MARRQLAGSQALGVFGRAVATELVLVWEGGDRRACIFLSFPLFILIDLYVKGAINGRRVQRGVWASSGSRIVARLGVERCLSTTDWGRRRGEGNAAERKDKRSGKDKNRRLG